VTRVTRFASRDPGPEARLSGFISHLRENGLKLGVKETAIALDGLTHITAANPIEARLALKAICAGSKDDAQRFDELFDSYWMDAGRVRHRPRKDQSTGDDVHSSRDGSPGQSSGTAGEPTSPDGGDGEAAGDGEGKLIATAFRNLSRKDLRDLVRPEEVAEAELVARRLGAALREKRSRRRVAALRGDRLHFRKTIRRSLATGGEPIRLFHRKRPDRALRIVALCDVSGSMSVYAKVFLAFLSGLMRGDPTSDAYLFHTRLVRITEALRDKDTLRAIGRMSLMADGFGGGSKIGPSLQRFAETYARRFVDGRSVVMIMSDGYDTAPAEHIETALTRLRKRGCRIIWLNPLKGWRDYQPVAAGMAAALPMLDLFAAANTLEDLASLESELVRL
jgi:uncharacterized protein with von Willebrand factor type A (vWA) domain